MFKDILKEKGKWSQGRIYLMWSILVYYLSLAILTISGIRKSEITLENFRIIIDALEYAMTLFAGYVFGGKFVDLIKVIKNPTPKDNNNQNEN